MYFFQPVVCAVWTIGQMNYSFIKIVLIIRMYMYRRISHLNFWCPKPVSYIRDWYVSYIGDRSRAPKKSYDNNNDMSYKFLIGILGARSPSPIYVGDWSVSYIEDMS